MTKEAWVTLVTNDTYGLGALVLGSSLRRVSTTRDTVVMVTPGISQRMREELARVYTSVVPVDVMDSGDTAHLALMARPELGVTFTKIHAWTLVQYSKCVFLDSDTLVIQNSDELFEREELSAAPDPGWPDCFNSGVFVFVPSMVTYQAILDFAVAHGSFDGGDQGLLNMFFREWATQDIRKHLPFIYNLVSSTAYTYLPAFKFFGSQVKIVHFLGSNKPWTKHSEASSSPFQRAWWSVFREDVNSHLSQDMTGVAGALARGDTEQWRKEAWEAGDADYMGRDSFDNIWKRICECVGISSQPTAKDSQPIISSEKKSEPEKPTTPVAEKMVQGADYSVSAAAPSEVKIPAVEGDKEPAQQAVGTGLSVPDVCSKPLKAPSEETPKPGTPTEALTPQLSAIPEVPTPANESGPTASVDGAQKPSETEKTPPQSVVPVKEPEKPQTPTATVDPLSVVPTKTAAPAEVSPKPAEQPSTQPTAIPAQSPPTSTQPPLSLEALAKSATPSEAPVLPGAPAEVPKPTPSEAPKPTAPVEGPPQPPVPSETSVQTIQPLEGSLQSSVLLPETPVKPEILPTAEKATEKTPTAEKAPEKPPTAEKAPEKPPTAEKAPEKPPTAEKAPEKLPTAEKSPEKLPTAEKAPEKPPTAEKAPEKLPTAEKAPEKLPTSDKAPEKLPTADKVSEKEATVEKTPEKQPTTEKTPTAEKVQEKLPTAEKAQEKPPTAEQALVKPSAEVVPEQTPTSGKVAEAVPLGTAPQVGIPEKLPEQSDKNGAKKEPEAQLPPEASQTAGTPAPPKTETTQPPTKVPESEAVCQKPAKSQKKGKETPKLPQCSSEASAKPDESRTPPVAGSEPPEASPGKPETPTITPASGPGSPLAADSAPEVCKLQATPSQPATPPAATSQQTEPPVPPKRKQGKNGKPGKGGKK